MPFSSPKEYLKQLKIQRFYVNKFKVNYANANDLTIICKNYIIALDKEIDSVEKFIANSVMKDKLKKAQVSIYDFMED